MLMDITGINLFDQNVDMACPEVRLRCSWISNFKGLILGLKCHFRTRFPNFGPKIGLLELFKSFETLQICRY